MNRNHLVAAALVAFMVAGAFAYFDNTLAAGISALIAALLILLWDLARYIEPANYHALICNESNGGSHCQRSQPITHE